MQRHTKTNVAAMILAFGFCLPAFAGHQSASTNAADSGRNQQQIPVAQPDITNDGRVNSGDLVQLMLDWGPCKEGFCQSDLNNDGIVNGRDLVQLILNWT